jgi:hypothetical protein
MLEVTLRAPKPREAMGQHPTRKELAELPLDEARQAVCVAAVRDFPEEGLEMLRMTVWSTECSVSRG